MHKTQISAGNTALMKGCLFWEIHKLQYYITTNIIQHRSTNYQSPFCPFSNRSGDKSPCQPDETAITSPSPSPTHQCLLRLIRHVSHHEHRNSLSRAVARQSNRCKFCKRIRKWKRVLEALLTEKAQKLDIGNFVGTNFCKFQKSKKTSDFRRNRLFPTRKSGTPEGIRTPDLLVRSR